MPYSNLTLSLDKKDAEVLNAPIKEKEMLRALVDTPKGKSPGMNKLPYECYKALPLEAANIGYQVSERKAQPASWAQILISVLPKEEDLYLTHKYRLISLLNTD
jgi:hypothetical protein